MTIKHEIEVILQKAYPNGMTVEEISTEIFGSAYQNRINSCLGELKEAKKIRRDRKAGVSSLGVKCDVWYYVDAVNTLDRIEQNLDSVYNEENEMTNLNALNDIIAKVIRENNFILPSPAVCIMQITHEEAELLKSRSNPYNRKVKAAGRNVKELIASMAAGKFKGTSMLVLSSDGTLIDGHHRITAHCSVGGVQTYAVMVGCEIDAHSTIDVGKRRSSKDTTVMSLALNGVELNNKQSQMASSIAQHQIAIAKSKKDENISITGTSASNPEIQEYCNNNSEFVSGFIKFIEECVSVNRSLKDLLDGCTKRAVLCRLSEMYKDNQTLTKAYVNDVIGGSMGGTIPNSKNTTAWHALEILNKYKTKESKEERRLAERKVSCVLMNSYVSIKTAINNNSDLTKTTQGRGHVLKTRKTEHGIEYVIPKAS